MTRYTITLSSATSALDVLALLEVLPDDAIIRSEDIERGKTMSTQLKIKILSLAAEAAIIRRQERKIAKAMAHKGRPKGLHPTWNSIQSHRRGVVRREQRHSLLAYAFLKGQQYHLVEAFCWTSPDLKKVEEMARRFEPEMEDFAQRWSAWEQNAKAQLKAAAEVRQISAKARHANRMARVPATPEQRAERKRSWNLSELARLDAQLLGLD